MRAIWRFVSEDKPLAALQLVEDLQAKCRLIADAPRSGLLLRPGSGIPRAFVGRYVIYYRPVAEGIDVLRVLAGDLDRPNVEDETS
jgi:toxin ParE1/3/4